jgi:hypothetical protein
MKPNFCIGIKARFDSFVRVQFVVEEREQETLYYVWYNSARGLFRGAEGKTNRRFCQTVRGEAIIGDAQLGEALPGDPLAPIWP